MASSRTLSRRKIIKAGMAAGAPILAGAPALSFGGILGANEFLRLAWVGVGGRGTGLLQHSLNCVSEATLKVTAICDIDPGAREGAVRRCGAMKPDALDDYRKVLERSDVDAVVIATPIHLHAEHAVAAVKAGKHVYCEKPLGRTAEEVKAVHDAVKKSSVKFQVGFQWRYHQGFLSFVDVVQGGRIGKVSFVLGARHVGGYPSSGWYVNRDLSGDLIVEQAVHEMNVFCWMLKSHPLRAAGFGGLSELKGKPPERTIMDHYSVTYEFPEDITVAYSHCIYTPSGLGGLHQTVYGSGGRGAILEDTLRLSVSQDGKKTPVPIPEIRDATELAILSFARCIREDKEPLAGVDAGKNATLMAILGRTAIHERRVVEWKDVAL